MPISFSVPSSLSVSGTTTTAALTIGSLTGILKASSGVVSAATGGTDYASAGAITTSGLTMSTAKMLGRATGGTGAIEEIAVTGSGNAVLSASPTLTGTVIAAALTASGAVSVSNTTSASSAITGALLIGNGTAATNVGIGGGNINAGGTITAGTTLADQGGTLAAQRNALAPAQSLSFNGTAGSTMNFTAGSGDFSVFVDVNVSALSDYTWVFHGGTSAFGLFINTGTYTIQSAIVGVADNTVSTGSLTPGIVAKVGYVKSGSTGTYYINGVAAGTTTDTRNYSAATTALGGASRFFTGTLRLLGIANRALSDAEVLALYQTGAVAAGDIATGGVGVSVVTGVDSTFVPNTGNWGAYNNGTLTQPGGSGTKLVYSVGGYNPAFGLYINTSYLTVGKWYKLEITLADFVGGTTCTVEGSTTSLVAGANTVIIQATSTQPKILCSGGTTGFSIAPGITFQTAGALIAPEANAPGAGLEWLDVSGNRSHIVLPTSGVSWALPSSQQIVIEATTNTATNQQLGAASLIDTNKQWRIQSWTVNCSTGTPTISLGNVSAGAQYVSGAVLAAGNNDITLLTRFPTTANLWCNSSTTATLIHRIVLVPAN